MEAPGSDSLGAHQRTVVEAAPGSDLLVAHKRTIKVKTPGSDSLVAHQRNVEMEASGSFVAHQRTAEEAQSHVQAYRYCIASGGQNLTITFVRKQRIKKKWRYKRKLC